MSSTSTIIIVNFNSGDRLARCLDSIATEAPGVDVLVVDNNSLDGSQRCATGGRSHVTLRENVANLGFARAVNQAVPTTHGELILLLNPDCCLLPRSIEMLTAEILSHPDSAIAAPQILNDDGGIQGNARGDPNILTGLFGRSTLLTRMFPSSRVAQRNVQVNAASNSNLSREVDWVSGACMLIRRDAFGAVGGFDERYFLYWEDADLCRRLRTQGYTIRHVPSAQVIHSAGGSSRTVPALAIRAFHRSAYTYYTTHVSGTPLARLVARILLAGRCRWKLLANEIARYG